MGRSKKVFGKSQKRPNGDIRSLLFKKKRTAEAALDALGAKLAAQKAQKAIDDKELARREDGAGNTYLMGIMMHGRSCRTTRKSPGRKRSRSCWTRTARRCATGKKEWLASTDCGRKSPNSRPRTRS